MRAICLLLVCGCAERALPLPDPPALTVDEFISGYAQARCERLSRCGFLDDTQQAKCLEYVIDEHAYALEGDFTFEASAAEKCLDRVKALDCKPYRDVFCRGVFVGRRGPGESCRFDCAPGLECGGDSCPPVCMMRPRVSLGDRGAACSDDAASCKEGLVCTPDRGCQPPGKEGETCFNTHVYYLTCAEGLVCQGADRVGRCGPFLKEGDSCTLLDACGDGLLCVGWMAPDTPGRCRPPIPEGQPCAPLDECRFYTVCLDGKCTAPNVALGETCAESHDNCATGYCESRICVPALPDGAPCDPSGSYKQCRSTVCQKSTGVCARCP
jgi:hypothetical protein